MKINLQTSKAFGFKKFQVKLFFVLYLSDFISPTINNRRMF